MAASEPTPALSDDELADLIARDPKFEEFLRATGRHSVDQLDKALALMMSETASTMRWILGALLTVNGGGIVVLSSANSAMEPEALRTAVAFLTGGCVLAILAALFSGLSAVAQGRGFGAAMAQWQRVAIAAEGLNDAIAAASAMSRRGLQLLVVGCTIGLGSLTLFVSGTLTAAHGFGQANEDGAAQVETSSVKRSLAN